MSRFRLLLFVFVMMIGLILCRCLFGWCRDVLVVVLVMYVFIMGNLVLGIWVWILWC